MNAVQAHNQHADRILSQDKGIFYKLDYVTWIVNDISLHDVFNVIGLQIDVDGFRKLFSESFVLRHASGTWITLNFNHVKFMLNYYEITYALGLHNMQDQDDKYNKAFDLLDLTLDKIKIDVSGQGLDYLRSLHINVEDLVINGFKRAGYQYHYTRIDFAYDIINYKPDFVKHMYANCKAYESRKGFVSCGVNKITGVSWSHKDGAEETLYIGNPASGNHLLRIYDKRLQYERSGQWNTVQCPYTVDGVLPDSWIRIELQERRQYAHELIESENYKPESILKHIYEKYAIRTGQSDRSKSDHPSQKISDDWIAFYDWNLIDRILQNAKYVEKIDAMDSVYKMLERARGSVMNFAAHYGIAALIDFYFSDEELERLQTGDLDRQRWNNIINKIYCVNLDQPKFIETCPDGIMRFKI